MKHLCVLGLIFVFIFISVHGNETVVDNNETTTVKPLGVVTTPKNNKNDPEPELNLTKTSPTAPSIPATVKALDRMINFKDVEEVEIIHPRMNPDVETIPAVKKKTESEIHRKTSKPVDSPKRDENFISNPRGLKASKLENIDYTDYDCLETRYAPTSDKLRQGEFPYVITEARLKKIRGEFLYCFFDKGGDYGHGDLQVDIHDSSPQIHKNLNFQLPFFGFRFNYTRISVNGYLQFSDPPVHYRYPLSFPNPLYPKENDPSFIGIFFSKCRIGMMRPDDVDQRLPGVYFRMERDLQTRTDQFGVEMRERLMWDIREGIIGAEAFIPKHSAIITWKNVSFAGGIDSALYKTNTFQLVLATDEVFTYAIFNYVNMDWTTHTEAGGDTSSGEGGTPAYVGFNAGNGTNAYAYLPYSQNSILRDLVGRGWGNTFPGRHIFRIDEKIMLGTCNKDYDNPNIPLVFAPESGNMLGGTVVNITGPCFEEGVKIQCRFDTETVLGTRKDRNRAICVQPFVFAEGYINLEVSVGNENFKWKGKYFIETPATATQKITFTDDDDVHKRNPAQIAFTWVPKNLTDNLAATVQISLWGYRENTIRPELLYIGVIEEGTNNDGQHTILPSNFRNRDNTGLTDLEFGFLMINLTNPETYEGLNLSPVIWSRPIPLGWYFNPQWEKLYGTRWPETKCNEWLMNDRYLKNFASEVPICPCTLEHALADKGRFLPETECDMDTNRKCYFNKGAVHCVRSGHPSKEGSGQQCCYDKNFYLMMSYDQQWGSRPQRSHNLGFLPWNEANKVPTLSNWLHDVIPFYQCCMWQDEQAVGCETFRFERRPTQDCIAYQSPAVGAVFGDPHIVTFDEMEYTFNGKGEFVLVRADTAKHTFDVQGRFEQMPINIHGEVRATHLTAIVAQENSSAIIEVRVRPRWAQWRYRLDVLADEKPIYFDRESLRIQHFRGVTVYQPRYILNQSQIILMFESGAGVEVVENRGYLSARVYLPWSYINQTKGLFGNWSYDMADDFTRSDNTIVNLNLNNLESIHKDFAMTWLLDDHEDEKIGKALFSRLSGRTSSFYTNRTFVPVWYTRIEDIIPANRSYDRKMAYDLCSDNLQCQYDYALTLNRDLAYFTKNYYSSIVNIRETNQKRVVSCGVLETPHFGRKSNFFFTPGSKVIFECNKDFVLQGDPRRTCNADGEWDTPIYGYTECLRQQEYSSRQAGITAGIIAIIIVPILLVLFCLAYHLIIKPRKQKEPNELSPATRPMMTKIEDQGDYRGGRESEID